MRQLIVNADDFGFTHDVNRGIIEAHTEGILTATTLMANGDAFADAVRLAREHPSLNVGCHLVLIQGNSLRRRGAPLPATLPQLIRALVTRSINPYDELHPQIQRILDAGIHPLHLDTHKHTHLWPQVLDAVARISQEFGIPWVRRPFDLPIDAAGVPWTKRVISHGVATLRAQFHEKLARHGCRTTDHFAGFQITGRFRTAELVSLLHQLPEGLTEFMTHPGRCGDELRAACTRLKESREDELAALVAPEVRTALREARIQVTDYRSLTNENG